MNALWRIATVVVVVVAGLVYLGLGYIAAAWAHPPLIALVVGLIPPSALALTSIFALPRRLRWPATAIWLLAMAAVLSQLEHLLAHAALFYFIQHAGAMGFLAFTFGNTLWASHGQALCSRMAKLMAADELDAAYLRYTYRVTAAWAIFFALSGCLSLGLYFWGDIEVWSLFANILSPLSVLGMFVVEYLVRIRVLPNRPHLSIVETIQAYQKYRRATAVAERTPRSTP